MEANQRPTGVTVIAIILIICACLLMITAAGAILIGSSPEVRKMLRDRSVTFPDNPQAQRMFAIRGWSLGVGCGVILISVIAVLKRQNWGRLLYLCFVPVWIAFAWFQSGFQRYFVLMGVLYLFALILLTLPKASAFFASGPGQGAKSAR